MDILRKELNEIYEAQKLGEEKLDAEALTECLSRIEVICNVDGACRVVTDASADTSYIFFGSFGHYLGLGDTSLLSQVLDSSDEDVIYQRINPKDLVEKRMLEYEFFKFIDKQPACSKSLFKATCKLRIMNLDGEYIYVDNTTSVTHLSPEGKIWLILCTYELAALESPSNSISPAIINNSTGEVRKLSFADRRKSILSLREKEILRLIGDGKLSKEIAATLGISINTVSRHRQNILEKLSVNTSIEALNAAQMMGLI